jgi:ribosomal-protein-alanine N-acetyltransferase
LSINVTGNEVSIRKMEQKDIQRVSEIDQISFSLPWPKNSFVFEVERNAAARAWVAETNDPPLIVGFIVTWLIVDELHIATLATDPTFRQHRIALKLMVHSLCCAAIEGARISLLEVRSSNIAARSLYQKLGYAEDGVRPRYYRDNHEDAILMSLKEIDSALLKTLL